MAEALHIVAPQGEDMEAAPQEVVAPRGGDMVAEEEVPLGGAGADMEGGRSRVPEVSWSATSH
jgi:hypothetical protein